MWVFSQRKFYLHSCCFVPMISIENLEDCLYYIKERKCKQLPRSGIYLIEILLLCVCFLTIKILSYLYNPQWGAHKSNSLASRVFGFIYLGLLTHSKVILFLKRMKVKFLCILELSWKINSSPLHSVQMNVKFLELPQRP